MNADRPLLVLVVVFALQSQVAQAQTSEEGADTSSGPNWGAILSFSGAGVATVLAVTSFAMVGSANDDLTPYRIRVGEELAMAGASTLEIENADICDEMKTLVAGDPSYQDGLDVCSRGKTWQALSWTFLGLAGAGIISGILFLVLGSDDDDDSQVSLLPSFDQNGASLTARMRF